MIYYKVGKGENMEYKTRVIDKILEQKLKVFGAVLIEGCKWCGKSTTGSRFSKSSLELANPSTYENNLEIAKVKPEYLLVGDKPRLIDEWQTIPVVWDAIRYDVDKSGKKGEYILTGSATVKEGIVKHTGTGRISRLLMRPMSLFESGDSIGSVSLKELFNTPKDIEGISNLELEDVAFLIARGGFPGSLDVPKKDALLIPKDYINSVSNIDINSIDNVERNPIRVKRVLKSLARNVSTSVNLSVIREDTLEGDNTITEKTISDYINVLEKLYIIENVEAWCPKLRSKTEIRVSKKREFVDPSLALASLNATDKDLLNDFKTFGFMFECLCIRDLKIYAESFDSEVFFYRDKSNLEVDAIIHSGDGKWGAVEIKLGSDETIDKAAESLIAFKNNVLTEEMGEPSFLMVLTATKYSYRRKDGVYVVPIGCLKD